VSAFATGHLVGQDSTWIVVMVGMGLRHWSWTGPL